MRFAITLVFMLGGLFFFVIGTIGLFRFREILTRIHATAKCDTLGALLCVIGLIVYNGINMIAIKLLLIIVFLWVTTPTATHLIAKCEMAFRSMDSYAKKETKAADIIYIGEDDGNGAI